MYPSEFDYVVEHAARSAVSSHFPLDWKEDPITHALLIQLRLDLHRLTLWSGRQRVEIEWEIYKFHGRRETAFGDIGLLVRYAVPGAGTVEGAGFLEAKLRGRDTTKFTQVRHDQVTRILQRSPQTRLLLYDYNPVAVLDPEPQGEAGWEMPFHRYPRYGQGSRVSHCPVLPLQLAATLNQYDDTLYRFSHSLAYQFSRRYFQLHDLDFTEAAIRAVKGFPSELGSPNFVMVIRIAPEGTPLPEPFVPTEDRYGGIGEVNA